jgi:hypothetical protein
VASVRDTKARLGMLVVETIAKIRRAYFAQNKTISDQDDLPRDRCSSYLCRNPQVSSLLQQSSKLGLRSETHGSIRVQEGEPNLRKGR